MSATLDAIPSMIDRIRHDLVGLKMPRALEALDHVVRRLEHGELSALEAKPTPRCWQNARRGCRPRPKRPKPRQS
ncbi:hypothetical protein ACC754_37280, partial [Rhizobium johnstonii]